jgi:hypothetical protein
MSLHPALIALALGALASAAVAGDAAPPAPALMGGGVIELHGTVGGQPFWARLLTRDKQFGNRRVLQLVWEPPSPDRLGGCHLSDCPFVLLDDAARVIAWNNREGLSQAAPAAPSGYQVTRELTQGEGDAARITSDARTIRGDVGWDLQLAPLLLALTWKAGGEGSVRIVDLFGTRAQDHLAAVWHGERAELAGEPLAVSADQHGHLHRLTDAAGAVRLEIAEWTADGSAGAAPP